MWGRDVRGIGGWVPARICRSGLLDGGESGLNAIIGIWPGLAATNFRKLWQCAITCTYAAHLLPMQCPQEIEDDLRGFLGCLFGHKMSYAGHYNVAMISFDKRGVLAPGTPWQ